MTKRGTVSQLTAERDFLLARAEFAGHATFTADRWVGISSNALVRAAFKGEIPDLRDYPRDQSDLEACRRTVDRLPEHLRARGQEVLSHYEKHLALGLRFTNT